MINHLPGWLNISAVHWLVLYVVISYHNFVKSHKIISAYYLYFYLLQTFAYNNIKQFSNKKKFCQLGYVTISEKNYSLFYIIVYSRSRQHKRWVLSMHIWFWLFFLFHLSIKTINIFIFFFNLFFNLNNILSGILWNFYTIYKFF